MSDQSEIQPATEGQTGSAVPVRAVERALALLEALNLRAVSSIDQLYRDTALPKPTIFRLLRTFVKAGYVTNDHRQGGYQVSAKVKSLSSGFHHDPLIVEAARPWAIALTRQLAWPVAVALLDVDAVAVRFSTIPDSPISPFHATLNRRLSLTSRGLGLAYLAFCPEQERQSLMMMLDKTSEPMDSEARRWLDWQLQRARENGYAERDPAVEPRNSSTIAVPVMSGVQVAATIGLTFFRIAVDRNKIEGQFAPLLKETARSIEQQIAALSSTLSK